MPDSPNNKHKALVTAWADKNAAGLSSEQVVRLFSAAIGAVEQRSLATLSNVTVMVVVDRALEECKEKYSLLADAKAEPQGLDLGSLLAKSGDYSADELRECLQELLAGLLSVLGNITADILTAPLHKQLIAITRENALQSSIAQPLHVVKAKKTNRDET